MITSLAIWLLLIHKFHSCLGYLFRRILYVDSFDLSPQPVVDEDRYNDWVSTMMPPMTRLSQPCSQRCTRRRKSRCRHDLSRRIRFQCWTGYLDTSRDLQKHDQGKSLCFCSMAVLQISSNFSVAEVRSQFFVREIHLMSTTDLNSHSDYNHHALHTRASY